MKKNIFILCLLVGLLLVSAPAFTQKNDNRDKTAFLGSGNTPPSKAAMSSCPPNRGGGETHPVQRRDRYPAFPELSRPAGKPGWPSGWGAPLTEMNIAPGDQVKKGDVLMQIDPQDYRDRIRILEAQLSVPVPS